MITGMGKPTSHRIMPFMICLPFVVRGTYAWQDHFVPFWALVDVLIGNALGIALFFGRQLMRQ